MGIRANAYIFVHIVGLQDVVHLDAEAKRKSTWDLSLKIEKWRAQLKELPPEIAEHFWEEKIQKVQNNLEIDVLRVQPANCI